jgi:CheY-like chemotaxis protein
MGVLMPSSRAVVDRCLQLPKLSGCEVARRIREQQGGAKILLVAVTGWGQDEDRRRSKEAGFDEHMTKPLELTALKKLLAASGEREPRA